MSVLPYVRRSGAALAALAVLVGISGCGRDDGPVAAPSATGRPWSASGPAPT
jgi:predicted small lipoprotein YifL